MKTLKKHRILAISIAMSLALLGIILIQVYWVKNAYDVNRERFFRQVDDHLSFVINQHEVLQTLALINDIDRKGFEGSSKFDKSRKLFARSDSSSLRLSSYELNIDEVAFEQPNTRLPKLDIETGSPYSMYYESDSIEQEKEIEDDLAKGDSQVVDFDKLRREQDGELFRFMRSFVRVYLSGDQSISEEGIDSLMSIEMKKVHPTIEYEYSIFKEQNDSIDSLYASGMLHNSDYKVVAKKLFPSAVEKDEAKIVLSVSSPHKYILSEMKIVMGSSALFLLIIIYAFSYTLTTLIKQGKLSDMKSDFINNMTHELKTPISTISLAAEALTDKSIQLEPSRISRLGELITKENERLKSQVDRVLQMDRLDRSKIKLDKKELHLNELLKVVLENTQIQVEKRSGTISWRLNATQDLVLADELHITNIFYNLLDNAMKYSMENVELNVESWCDDKSFFCSIEDHGIGIPREMLEKVFERFYRVSTGNRHDVKGFGLGLSYVKEMIELHGGRIKVTSKIDKGSKFTIQLPRIKK